MEERWFSIVWIALALILPITALVGRKLEWKKWIVLALVWAAIFFVTAGFIAAVRG
jgi:hypothetical protein